VGCVQPGWLCWERCAGFVEIFVTWSRTVVHQMSNLHVPCRTSSEPALVLGASTVLFKNLLSTLKDPSHYAELPGNIELN